jgi:hypothetical protein
MTVVLRSLSSVVGSGGVNSRAEFSKVAECSHEYVSESLQRAPTSRYDPRYALRAPSWTLYPGDVGAAEKRKRTFDNRYCGANQFGDPGSSRNGRNRLCSSISTLGFLKHTQAAKSLADYIHPVYRK